MFSTTANAQRSATVNSSDMNAISEHRNGGSTLSSGVHDTLTYSATVNSCDVFATSAHMSEKNVLNSDAKDILVYNATVDTGSSDMNAYSL
jgi:hypothetical protein